MPSNRMPRPQLPEGKAFLGMFTFIPFVSPAWIHLHPHKYSYYLSVVLQWCKAVKHVMACVCLHYNKTQQPWISFLEICLCGSRKPCPSTKQIGFSSIFLSPFFFFFNFLSRVCVQRETVYTLYCGFLSHCGHPDCQSPQPCM